MSVLRAQPHGWLHGDLQGVKARPLWGVLDPTPFSPSLQMVLLWSVELFPSPEDWQDLEGSVYRLLVILLRCLATRHLPHFLHPEENLFQGEALDLTSLYHRVESFAQDPRRFLRFHFGLPARTDSWLADPSTRALLHLPAEDRSYWDTAYFDILLSQVTPDPQLVSRGRARLETTWSGQLRMCWNLPPQSPPALGSHWHGMCCPTLSWRLREAGSAGAQGSSRVGSPLSSLCTCLCLVPGVPDPGQRAPLGNVPAALQDPASKPLAELSRTPLPPHLGDSKLRGGARRAAEPGAACCQVALLRKDGTGERVHVCCSWVGMHSLSAPLVELGAGAGVSSQDT